MTIVMVSLVPLVPDSFKPQPPRSRPPWRSTLGAFHQTGNPKETIEIDLDAGADSSGDSVDQQKKKAPEEKETENKPT